MSTHSGRIAVVTGAAAGIGQATAQRLAGSGAAVVAVDRNWPAETLELLESAGTPGHAIQADVSDPAQTERIGQEVASRFGQCDILVNNVGIYPVASIDEMTYALWRKVLTVNLDSQFLMVKAVLPLMVGWGRIVNISSNSIVTEIPGLTPYMASKMGVIGFSRALANDLGERGITVNAVAPAYTNTPGTKSNPEELATEMSRRQAIKKFAQPEDIVGMISFLTSEDGQFITGQTLMVDGGMGRASA